MGFFRETSDRSFIEIESQSQFYRATLRKKKDECLYKKYFIINIKLDEYDKFINDYITSHNKKFNVYLVNCEYKVELEFNFIINLETNYVCNIESKNLKIYLLYCIDCLKL